MVLHNYDIMTAMMVAGVRGSSARCGPETSWQFMINAGLCCQSRSTSGKRVWCWKTWSESSTKPLFQGVGWNDEGVHCVGRGGRQHERTYRDLNSAVCNRKLVYPQSDLGLIQLKAICFWTAEWRRVCGSKTKSPVRFRGNEYPVNEKQCVLKCCAVQIAGRSQKEQWSRQIKNRTKASIDSVAYIFPNDSWILKHRDGSWLFIIISHQSMITKNSMLSLYSARFKIMIRGTSLNWICLDFR